MIGTLVEKKSGHRKAVPKLRFWNKPGDKIF
jgi:hypothetical protein